MFKYFKEEDFVLAESPVRENVLIRRTYFSGGSPGVSNNISSPTLWTSGSLSGGIYLCVHDRDYNESPRQKLYTITYGQTVDAPTYPDFTGNNPNRDFYGLNHFDKNRIYKLFAQTLLGNKDLKFKINNKDCDEAIFICMNRNIYKDAMMPETVELRFQTSGAFNSAMANSSKFSSNMNVKKSFGGRFVGLNTASLVTLGKEEGALCFLDKGIFVIDPHIAIGTSSAGGNAWSGSGAGARSYEELAKGVSGSTYDDFLFGIRHRIRQLSFTNESKVKTSFYRCTAEFEEFNYSSNPSYIYKDNKIRWISGSSNLDLKPKTFITTIGLLNKNKELLGVAKLVKPIKKDFDTKVSITVRLDY